MGQTPQWYDAHLEQYRGFASIRNEQDYADRYKTSIEEPERFWAEMAEECLSFEKTWDFVLRADFADAGIEWFGGARLNACFNCLDRHLPDLADKTAVLWEGAQPGESRTLTYRQLYDAVNRLAAYLLSRGVRSGDRVLLYLPSSPELVTGMLACSRVGATYCVVFSEYSSVYVAHRLKDLDARCVLTADVGFALGEQRMLKSRVDEALKDNETVHTVIVVRRSNTEVSMAPGRDMEWDEALSAGASSGEVSPVPMDSEDPLFVMFTGGSTGKPKGLVHTHAGYLVYAAVTARYVFDVGTHDVIWIHSDPGWIPGHTYGVYGTLLHGATTVLHERVFAAVRADQVYETVEKHGVEVLGLTPTAIRSLQGNIRESPAERDLSSLKLLNTFGEHITPEEWEWLYRQIGQARCPIVHSWMQSETGGIALTSLPGTGPLKPGACREPFFGIQPVILDPNTGEEAEYPNQEGILCIKEPWPGITRTAFRDHDRFAETYFTRILGMFFTGDRARRDEDGWYWFTGRLDDVVNVGGCRIGLPEIETALARHESVGEAGVVGFRRNEGGQGVYAFVTPVPGARISESLERDLIEFVRAHIGSFVHIDVMQWTDRLPKTRSGKILRRLLQYIAAGRYDEITDTSTLDDPEIVDGLIAGRKAIMGT